MFFFSKFREIVWGKPAATKVERRLILKLDVVILSFCCLMYWVNYLDRMNLNNAYISGMKKDLNFHGTQLNVINTSKYRAVKEHLRFHELTIFSFLRRLRPGANSQQSCPSQKLPPRIYFPSCMIAWGLLTLGTGFTHHPWQIMVIRFFHAIFEASTFVGCHYILGSWYKEEELGKRTAIFKSSGLVGTMFSGFLQGSIHKTLNGKSGLPGWRWLFIIDFCITIPVALLGFVVFPDVPSSTKARWLTTEEKKLAIERLPEVKKVRGTLGWSVISRVLGSWHLWALVLIWTWAGNTEMFSTNAIMNLWLSDTGDYSVEQVNYIPTGVAAVGVVATLFLGWYTDFTKRHWHSGVILSITALISGPIMLNPPSKGAKFFALFINGCQYASQTVMFAWANSLTRHDDAKRGIVLAAMNTLAIAVYMFWSLLFYNAAQAPHWKKGSIAMLCMASAFFLNTLVVQYLQRRTKQNEECEGIAPTSEPSVDGQTIDMEKSREKVTQQLV